MQSEVQHFILTRFNLLLWNKDKEGVSVRSREWLDHRFDLFEKYCLPSIEAQSCKDFIWIVLFDSKTPDDYKIRIGKYQSDCPQLVPVYVEPQNGRYFADIFRKEVLNRLSHQRVITTYLDNDDALSIHFVEDLQKRAGLLSDGIFINYIDGYQYYTDHNYLIHIHYSRNHFMSVVEEGNPATLKTIYGFGSHYYIDKISGVRIEHIKNQPMWCEVIHDRNMGNDAYFLKAKMVKDKETLSHDFAIKEKVESGICLYLFRFLPRFFKTLIRRVGYRLYGRHW